MSNKIELKLNKSSIFRVVGFLSDINVNEEIEEMLTKVDIQKVSAAGQRVVGGQLIMKIIASSERQADELFADLADVDVEVIQELDFEEFFDLVETFIEAGLLQRAFKLFRGTREA